MVHLPLKIQLHSCGWVGFPVKKDGKNLANQAPCFPGQPWFTSTAFQALKIHLGDHHLGPWGIWSCQKPLRCDRGFSIKRWFRIGIPSGKHIQTNYGKSPYFNGWIHYFYGHFQVRKLLVINREYGADMPLPRSSPFLWRHHIPSSGYVWWHRDTIDIFLIIAYSLSPGGI
jgi:hypothetical protein